MFVLGKESEFNTSNAKLRRISCARWTGLPLFEKWTYGMAANEQVIWQYLLKPNVAKEYFPEYLEQIVAEFLVPLQSDIPSLC